jgi:hypothetical protein
MKLMMFKTLTSRLLAIIALTAAFASTSASAAAYYVRSGASGANNGSDWTNAWSQMDGINYAALVPGDTVYIAAGTYGGLYIAKSGAPGRPLTFKRATVAEHGTATGWNNAFDGRVIIDGGDNRSAIGIGETTYSPQQHITIDGATRYGIWVRNAYYGVRAVYGAGSANAGLTLRYLEIGDAGAYRLDEDGVQGRGDDLLIENCYIHDNDSGITHGDGVQWFEGNSVTFRYNVFKNSGQLFKLGEESWANNFVGKVNIYYNLFYNRGGGHYNGMVFARGAPLAGQTYNIFNNTFDLESPDNSGFNSVFYPIYGPGTVNFRNNAVLYSNAAAVNDSTHTYNAYLTSGRYMTYYIPGTETGKLTVADFNLVNIEAANYRPNAGSPLIGKGVNVGLAVDFDGKAVPANPTIGAFEGASSTAAASPGLAPPANLVAR